MSPPTVPTDPHAPPPPGTPGSEAPISVIESANQLRILAEEKDLAGKTCRGVIAPGFGLAEADLFEMTFERVGLVDANLYRVRLENTVLRSVDMTRANLSEALLHRFRAHDCDLTEINLEKSEIRRSELGPQLRMPRGNFSFTRIQQTTFRQVELARASFQHAVILKSNFAGYGNSIASLGRANFHGAVLVDVEMRELNLYGADFTNALLFRCDLRAANLGSAKLKGCHMIDCRTEGTDLSDAEV